MSTRLSATPTPPPLPSAAIATSTPAPAVEVVTTLGTSIVSVDHLRHAPARRSRSTLMLGLGGMLLATAALTFGSGVLAAHRDAAAKEQWLKENRPAWAFRSTRHGHATDWLALGSSFVGLGLCASGLLARRERTRTSLRVGHSDGVDIPLADAPPELTLCASDGRGQFVANLTGLRGEVHHSTGKRMAIEEMLAAGRTTVPMSLGTRVRARLGNTTFHLKGVEESPATAVPAVMSLEKKALGFVAASAVVHVGAVALLAIVPPDSTTAPVGLPIVETAGTLVHLEGKDNPQPEKSERGDADNSGSNGGATSKLVSMAIDDGRLGTHEPNPTPGKLKVMNRDREEQLAVEQAIGAGVLGSDRLASPIAVYNGGSVASGFDNIDITGAIFDGGGSGGPTGSFGTGIKGDGLGCGRSDGKPCQGVHAGPFETIGLTGQDGPQLSMRPGGGLHGGTRINRVPPITIGKPECVADSCFDKEIIRRYVRRNLEKITYCYEKELLAKPGLEGTVTALFTVSGNGSVVESRASGVDPAVASCIAQVMSTIQFPKVGQAGIYPIKYPFSLRPSGSTGT